MTSPISDPADSGGRAGRSGRAALTTRDKVRRLLIGLFVAACVGGMVVVVSNVREIDADGDEVPERADPDDVEISGDSDLVAQVPPGAASGGPSEAEIVEQTIPADGAETLQQAQIGIDVGDLYDVVQLSINGTVLRDDELVRRPELNQVFFQPGEDFTFDALPPGRVCARADVVRVTAPNEIVRAVEWCFEVT